MYFPKDMTFQYFFFDTYPGYFLQVLPIAIIVGCLYYFIKYKNNKEVKMSKKFFSSMFVTYITGLICLVLGMDIINNLWYKLLYNMDSVHSINFFDFTYDFIPSLDIIDGEKIGNILMFLPFGLLYPLANEKKKLKQTILTGFLFVIIIEFMQPIFARAFDINDVILNTLGITMSTIVCFIIRDYKVVLGNIKVKHKKRIRRKHEKNN